LDVLERVDQHELAAEKLLSDLHFATVGANLGPDGSSFCARSVWLASRCRLGYDCILDIGGREREQFFRLLLELRIELRELRYR
jgi:hypothetical protein